MCMFLMRHSLGVVTILVVPCQITNWSVPQMLKPWYVLLKWLFPGSITKPPFAHGCGVSTFFSGFYWAGCSHTYLVLQPSFSSRIINFPTRKSGSGFNVPPRPCLYSV